MTKDFKYFILDNINTDWETGHYCSLEDGVNIRIKFSDSTPIIATVKPDVYGDINTTFIGPSLQDCVTDWDQFIDLVKTLDEAYNYITWQLAAKN